MQHQVIKYVFGAPLGADNVASIALSGVPWLVAGIIFQPSLLPSSGSFVNKLTNSVR